MRFVVISLLLLLFAPVALAIADYDTLRDLVYRHPQHAAQELDERLEHQLHTAEDFGRLSALLATAYNGLRSRDEALRIVDRALLRLPEVSSQPRAELLMVRGMVLFDKGEIQQAQRYFNEVIKLAQELNLKPLRTEVLTRVAMINASLDQFEQALSHIRQAHALAAELKDERLQALVASEMASLYTQMGQYETALGYYQQGYSFSQNKGDPVESMTSLFNLANTLRHLKRFAEAQERYLQSLAIAREQGLEEDIAHTMLALAGVNLLQDNPNKAWQWMESIAQLNYGQDDVEYQIEVLLQRTEVLLKLGRSQDAVKAMRETRKLLQRNPTIAALWATDYPRKLEAAVQAALGDYQQAYEQLLAYSDNLQRYYLDRARQHEMRLRVVFDAERQQSEYQLMLSQLGQQKEALLAVSAHLHFSRWLLGALALALAAALLFGWRHWRWRQRTLAERDCDPLTGLDCRQSFLAKAAKQCQEAAEEEPFVLAMLDIDHLRRLNSHFGYEMGDRVIADVAQRIRRHLTPEVLLTRLGGGEFALLLPSTPGPRALTLVERLRAAIAKGDFTALAAGVQLSLSCGLAYREPGERIDSLMSRAEKALLAARSAGRNCCRLYEPPQ